MFGEQFTLELRRCRCHPEERPGENDTAGEEGNVNNYASHNSREKAKRPTSNIQFRSTALSVERFHLFLTPRSAPIAWRAAAAAALAQRRRGTETSPALKRN